MQKQLVKAFASFEAGGLLKAFEYEIEALKPHEILIETSHCGICHSDLHLVDNSWRSSIYPLVPGHEIVGRVKALGSEVGSLSLGQRVGVGWQASACLECDACVSGQENLCGQSTATAVARHGGFGDHVVVDSRFAFGLPEDLPAAGLAPLLCGGITVYSPLRRLGVRHWHRVGVVGIGGLGHMALQFARAMGCEVTAFSSTASKADEAKDLGAKHFVHTRADGWDKTVRGKLDFILVTATADLDWKPYVKALASNGQLCFVTGDATTINIPAGMLLGGQKSISGSIIGGRAMMREMIAFAARQNVRAVTESMTLSADQINLAMAKLRQNDARYRIVLEL